MSKRQIAAAIVGAIGFVVCLSAVSQAEFDGIYVEEFAARSVIGILLMFAAVPLSGDIDGEKKNR